MPSSGVDRDCLSGTVFVSDSRRKAPRKAVHLVGEVSFGDRESRMDCRIVDMSATGARLKLETSDERMQERIALFFDQRLTIVECFVIWSRDDEVGVQFCSQFNRDSRPN
ncbi:MAG: PilZ domain-containing protein [Hyphomicrobiaceae bacterium]